VLFLLGFFLFFVEEDFEEKFEREWKREREWSGEREGFCRIKRRRVQIIPKRAAKEKAQRSSASKGCAHE
jgi:hypothetical protein